MPRNLIEERQAAWALPAPSDRPVRSGPEGPLLLVEGVVKRVFAARVQGKHPDVGSTVLRHYVLAPLRIPDGAVCALEAEAGSRRPLLSPALEVCRGFRLDAGAVCRRDVMACPLDADGIGRADCHGDEVLDEQTSCRVHP